MNRPPIAAHPRSVVALDLIRGLAAFAVLFCHIRLSSFAAFNTLPLEQRTPVIACFFAATRLGEEAVLIFFVLSGFLVGGQLILRLQNSTFDVRIYAIDRASRILVPLVPICLSTGAINVALYHEPLAFAELLGNMAGLNGVLVDTLPHNAPLWSLALEIWFYVIGGALAYLLSGRRKSVLIVAFGFLLFGAYVFTALPTRFLLYWIIGALTVTLVNAPRRTGVGIAGIAVLVGGIALRQFSFGAASITPADLMSNTTPEMVICAGFCLALPLLCSSRINEALQFLRKPAAVLAGFSYSLYLSHYPIDAVNDLFLPRELLISRQSMMFFLIRSCTCIMGAIIFFFLFERQTKTVRRYLNAKVVGASRHPREEAVTAE